MKGLGKKILTLALAATLCLGTGVLSGCKGKIANDENTLEIYIGNFGYGYKWLDEAIELFKEQDWVKERYPNLNIPTPQHNSDRQFPANRIISGASANTIDLFFAVDPVAAYYDRTDPSTGESYFADLTDVYESTVPNESVTVAEKMDDARLESQEIEKKDGGKAYYGMPWADVFSGILYNKSFFDKYFDGRELPRTTDEFIALAADVKNTKDDSGNSLTPFIFSARYNYWMSSVVTWWAQYEGRANYRNFWLGVNEMGEYDGSTFSQKGRLRALEALEDLISRSTGNSHKEATTMEFTTAQAKYLLGEAMFMPNGDWFENEMRATQAENPYNYDITYMRMPVISAIVEKLSYRNGSDYMSDEMLSDVIKAIDGGETSFSGVSENDFKKIKDARSMLQKSTGHEAFIPAYASAKDLAKDFLRFLATDAACRKFSETTGGCSTPFEYDLQTSAPELYASFSDLHKDKFDILKNAIRLPAAGEFKLNYYGGMGYFTRTSSVETVFVAQNSADRKTAQEVWQADIDHFTSNGYANWNALLTRTGL